MTQAQPVQKPIRAAYIGITVEQAADYIRRRWDHYQQCKGNKLELNEYGGCTFEQIMRVYTRDQFRADLRDCGWCLGHSGGLAAMIRAHDLAIKGLNRNGEGCQLSVSISHAFSGIANWLA